MFVVLVDFIIKPGFESRFKEAMMEQAENSLALESECHYFDVCIDQKDADKISLYELYTDAAAFDVHLASEHFLKFDQLVSDWIRAKSVRLLDRIEK